jgi:hypothetical protein
MLQMPPQQSNEFEQESPVWTQNDGVPQMPAVVQYLEQHSAEPPHVLPAVLQVLSGTHFPVAQLPPQHWPLLVQAPLSETHCVAEHMPLIQLSVPHCVLDVQPAFGGRPVGMAQVWAIGSHTFEQH